MLGIGATVLVVVPLLSRILYLVKDKVLAVEESLRQWQPPLGDLLLSLASNIELPITLKLLTYSAISVLIGKIVYEVLCPKYIKSGNSYAEFRLSQPNATELLLSALLKIMQGDDMEKKAAVLTGIGAHNVQFSKPVDPLGARWTRDLQVQFSSANYSPLGRLEYVMGVPWVAEPVFFVLRDLMDDSWKLGRIVCAMTYYIAFALLTAALSIQISWAVRGLMLGG